MLLPSTRPSASHRLCHAHTGAGALASVVALVGTLLFTDRRQRLGGDPTVLGGVARDGEGGIGQAEGGARGADSSASALIAAIRSGSFRCCGCTPRGCGQETPRDRAIDLRVLLAAVTVRMKGSVGCSAMISRMIAPLWEA